ncbi:MAG: outer membrane protein transport protein [candidate division Zixibacteria bacterium]|nr:outer membrane protein transport protein [candidate division Zixibacteria bacterium]
MKTLVSLIVLLTLCFAAFTSGQTAVTVYPALTEVSYSYFGSGARAMAMGSAFVGVANDVNGGTWNPAGIWVLEDPMVSGSYNMFRPNGEFTHSMTPLKTKNSISMNSIGHFSFITPIRIKSHPWVFNFNYLRNNEQSVRADYASDNFNSTQDDRVYLKTYNFGMSTRLYKKLSFGFLINVYDGGRVFKTTNTSSASVIIDPVNNISVDYVFDAIKLDSVKASGVNFTLGTMYKMDKVSIGAVLRTPFEMKNNTDVGRYRVTTRNGQPLIDDSDTVYVVDSLTKQEIPLSLAFGIGVQPNDKLTIALDANYQKYGSVKWSYLESTMITAGGDREDTYQQVPIDWNNTFGIGGGIEYKINTPIGLMPLRAGLRYNQLPQPKDYTITNGFEVNEQDELTGWYRTTYSSEGRQSETQITFGTGVHWSQLEIDFAYRITSGADLTIISETFFEKEGETPISGPGSTQVVETKTNEFNISIIGHF